MTDADAEMIAELTARERSILEQFGFPPDREFSDLMLARRVLEFPNTTDGWFTGAAVTLAAATVALAREAQAARAEAERLRKALEQRDD